MGAPLAYQFSAANEGMTPINHPLCFFLQGNPLPVHSQHAEHQRVGSKLVWVWVKIDPPGYGPQVSVLLSI